MHSDYYSELVGDKFVHHLQVDFINRQTILILGGHPQDEMTGRYTLTFNEVVLQDLHGMQPHNLLWGIAMSDEYSFFHEQEKDYLEKMKNYFVPGFLEQIQLDISLRYYFISSTTGLSGFIICRHATLVKE